MNLVPDLYVERIEDLEPRILQARGLHFLLLDVDSTLKDYRAQAFAPSIVTWTHELKRAEIGICLVSNGGEHRIAPLARQLGVPYVARAAKPAPYGCWRALQIMAASRRATALAGDQLLADVLAGKLAGLFTILVKPVRPELEPWFTQLKRPWERALLRRYRRRLRFVDGMHEP